jgi:hypothetical protein
MYKAFIFLLNYYPKIYHKYNKEKNKDSTRVWITTIRKNNYKDITKQNYLHSIF